MHTLEDCIKDVGEIPLCQCANNCGLKVNINPRYYYKYKREGYPKYINHHTSKEFKNIISKTHNGIPKSEEHKKKISESNKIYFKIHPDAHKGENHPLFGTKVSEERKQKQINSLKNFYKNNPDAILTGENHPMYGKTHSDEYKEKLRVLMSGENNPKYWLGKHLSEEHKEKLRQSSPHLSGKDHPNWNGGTSFFPYCPKFNELKKEEVRDKYNRCCILCGKHESQNVTSNGKLKKLPVHHLDYNKLQGCDGHEWRLVPLCNSCHGKTNIKNHKYEWEIKIKNIINTLEIFNIIQKNINELSILFK